MARTIGSKGLALIKKYEGCKLTAYEDSVGVWTIGYGHTKNVIKGMKITQAQADKFLKEDCQYFANIVDNPKYVPITSTLTSNERDALISFAYNVGPKNLKNLCANRNKTEIAEHIPAYNKAGGKVLSGLVRRRKEEQELFLKDAAKTSTTAKKELEETSKNPYIKPTKTVKYGSKGAQWVKWVQWILKNRLGYNVDIDGKFGPYTRSYVRKFQKDYGLKIDGIVGPITRKALAEL